jgi:CRISPR-associated protein Cas1
MLNYSYAILMAYISRSIVKKGLDTRISIFHKSFSNYYALASDLMEPFRPIVDFKVYQIINDKPNDFIKLSNAKTQLIDLFNKKINILNKDEYINNAIDNFIDGIVDDLNVIDFEIKYGEL